MYICIETASDSHLRDTRVGFCRGRQMVDGGRRREGKRKEGRREGRKGRKGEVKEWKDLKIQIPPL